MIIVCAFLLLAIVAANYALHRDVLYPGFLQAFLWLFTTVLFVITRRMFIPVAASTFVLFVTGVVLFSMGAFVASHNHRPVFTENRLLDGSIPSKRAVFV